MLDQNAIRTAIRRQLFDNAAGSIVALPNERTQFSFENRDFDPPDASAKDIADATWIRETFIWGQEDQRAYGYLELIGVVQYDVVVPAGRGTEHADNLVKLIGDALKHATGIMVAGADTPSGQQVQLSLVKTEPGRGAKWNDGPWYSVPVRTTFRAFGTTAVK